ncbi:MAG: C40 family peptidase [Chloroflexi bacterium]|nr:C40 family peptidase [Chloroflexota bacterium]
MVHGLREEQLLQRGKGRLLDRRQAVCAAVFVIGMSVGARISDSAEAAKKKKRKHGKKGKSKEAASASGNEVVRVAQKYKGSRYVWGGASPKGFDCSGFTWYVYQKATGMDITRGVDEQWQFGHSVRQGEWQAGDIVFFKNTFERGLSHCGIFIRGNEFIHAENEQTGVIISTLDSDYYSDHYAGARRLL